MTVYLSVAQIRALHETLVREFGGRGGLRDLGGLASAAARPAMTFGGEDLYPDLPSKAAALLHSLVLNHPFVDGNKRVGAAAAEFFLELNDLTLSATDEDVETVTVATAQGKVTPEALSIWFRQRSHTVLPE